MEYRHLSKMRGTKKLLWNWNISTFQLLMDCLIYIITWNHARNSEIHFSNHEIHWYQYFTVPWNSMELFQVKREVPWNSMELWKFHGTWCQHQIPWNSMNSMESPHLEQKLHGIPWNFKSSMEFCYITKFHGIPWNHYNQLRSSMEFHEVPWNLAIKPNSMEFHGISMPSWEVPWNSMKLRKFHGTWSDTKFHGIPWNSSAAKWTITKFHRIPRNSLELRCRQMNYHRVPWNSMELWDCNFNWHNVPLNFCEIKWKLENHVLINIGILLGVIWNIPWNSMKLLLRQIKHHRVPWNSLEQGGRHFKWHRVPWNSMELWCCQIKCNLVPLNSMEGVISNGIFHGIPWNSSAWFLWIFLQRIKVQLLKIT